MNTAELLDMNELAAYIGRSYQSIYSAIWQRRIPDAKLKRGCHRLFTLEEAERIKSYFTAKRRYVTVNQN